MTTKPYDELVKAGLVQPGVLTDEEIATVNTMSDEEVKVLIKIAQKLGPSSAGRHEARPNFPL